jgi:hypothetical protein
MVSTHTKNYCEKFALSHQILKKNLKLPDSYNRFQQAGSQNIKEFLSFSTFL